MDFQKALDFYQRSQPGKIPGIMLTLTSPKYDKLRDKTYGQEYIRVQVHSNYKDEVAKTYKRLTGKDFKASTQFPKTEAGLKDAIKFYKSLKPYAPKDLIIGQAAKGKVYGDLLAAFRKTKEGYVQEFADFIKKHSSDSKYNVRGGVNKLFNDALKFFKKDPKYSSVPEGFKTKWYLPFLKGDTFSIPSEYEILKGFKAPAGAAVSKRGATPGRAALGNTFLKSFIATQLLENNPNFVNIRDLAKQFYTTDVERKELLKENPKLVAATSKFLSKNNILQHSAAGKYLQNQGFDFNKKLYNVLRFQTVEDQLRQQLKNPDLSSVQREKIETARKRITRNRTTVFSKLKAEFPNLTKGQAMVLEHGVPQGLVGSGSFYSKYANLS